LEEIPARVMPKLARTAPHLASKIYIDFGKYFRLEAEICMALGTIGVLRALILEKNRLFLSIERNKQAFSKYRLEAPTAP
jgi:hypothetical protein